MTVADIRDLRAFALFGIAVVIAWFGWQGAHPDYPTHEERCVVQLHGTLAAPAVCTLPDGRAVPLP